MFLDEILDEECVCIEKKSFRGVCDRNAVIRIRADGSTRKSSDGAVFLLYHSLCRLEALLGPAPLRVRAGSRDDASHGHLDLPLVLGMATGRDSGALLLAATDSLCYWLCTATGRAEGYVAQ